MCAGRLFRRAYIVDGAMRSRRMDVRQRFSPGPGVFYVLRGAPDHYMPEASGKDLHE